MADAFRLWFLLLIVSAVLTLVLPVMAGFDLVSWWQSMIPLAAVVGLILAGMGAFCVLLGMGHRI